MKVPALIVVGSGLVSAAPANGGGNFFSQAIGALRANMNGGGAAMSAGGPGNAQAANNPGTKQAAAQGVPNLTASQKVAVQNAIQQWSLDTSLVSCSLNMLPSGQLNQADFMDLADAAYDAEVDETIQKATLDALLGDMPMVQSASANLTNGTFISVVDGLREMRIRGDTNNTQPVVNLINNNRCRPVMEAIDAYLAAGAMAVGNTTVPTAVRPQACMQINANTNSQITQRVINNCTSAPRANELARDYGQSPTFQLSNAVTQQGNVASDNTGALGDSFPNAANQSSVQGAQPQLFPNGLAINGDPANVQANPANAVAGNTGNATAQPAAGNNTATAQQAGNNGTAQGQ